MKKSLLSLVVCLMAVVMVFAGCSTALTSAPNQTSNMKVMGDALVYDEYVYFANGFKSKADLTTSDNDAGKVTNEAMYRVKTTNGKIIYDEETGMPKDVELVVSKVLGSEHTFMYSIGEYIYFASPNTHKDKDNADKFEYSSYFVVKTDGTGLKELYTTASEVTEQRVLNIDGKYYLVFIDGTKAYKIALDGAKKSGAVELAKDFTSAIFADSYSVYGDQYLYYLSNLEEEKTEQNITGTYLNRVDIASGEDVRINISSAIGVNITFAEVDNGKLYFKMNNGALNYYYEYTPEAKDAPLKNLASATKISGPIDALTVNDFKVMLVENNSGSVQTYYIYSASTSNTNNLYVLKNDSVDFASNVLLDKKVNVLFTDGDYIYYCIESDGIYRISVKDKEPQKISDMTDFKTTNITFDGKYVYFYAKDSNNTTGTYYMYRASVKAAELGNPCDAKLVGFLAEDDLPEEQKEKAE